MAVVGGEIDENLQAKQQSIGEGGRWRELLGLLTDKENSEKNEPIEQKKQNLP